MIGNIRDLEKLRISHEDSKKTSSNSETYMLKSMRIGKNDLDQVVVIDEKLHDAAKEMKKRILEILTENENSERISIAALAETVDEFLENNNKKAKKSSKKSINSESNDDKNSNEVA